MDPKLERAIRRNLTMTGPQAAKDIHDELVEAGVEKDVAELVYGIALLTPEMLEAQREENARCAQIIELRERARPNIFYPSDWQPPLWLRLVAPFYRALRNIWRAVQCRARR
jgi:hypothetical protein